MDRKSQLTAVAGLVALSCLVQLVLIRRATVPALDAVRFARTAQRIDSEGLRATLRQGREEPLFPAWVWLVYQGVERVGGPSRSSWADSVQLAAAIPLVLAVVPVYLLSVRLVGPAAGLAGALLFCVLPEVSRLGADGLSDSTHLFLFCLAFWAAAAYLMGPRGPGRRVQGSGFEVQDSRFGDSEGDRKPRLRVAWRRLRRHVSAPHAHASRGHATLVATSEPVFQQSRARSASEGAQEKREGPRLRVGLVSDSERSGPMPAGLPPPVLPWSAPVAAGNPGWLLAAGALVALATLVRTEALVLLVALGVTLPALQFQAFRRGSWARPVVAGACLVLGCGLVWGPYLAAAGATTPRAAVARLLGRNEPKGPPENDSGTVPVFPQGKRGGPPPKSAFAAPRAEVWQLDNGEPMSFALKEQGLSLRRRGYAAAALKLAEELADAFGYLLGGFALFCVWRLRRRLVRPVDRFAQVYVLLFLSAVLHFAAREGYVSARHLLTLVVVGIGCVGYGVLEAGAWVAVRKRRPQDHSGTGPSFPQGKWDGPLPKPRSCFSAAPESAGSALDAESGPWEPERFPRSRLAWVAVALSMAVCLAQVVEPLHAGRQGHRLAARWLAEEADTPGCVLDTRGWTGLYSGRTTYGYHDAPAVFGHPRLAYVVLERRELEYEGRRTRTLKHLLGVAAEPAATFPDAANGGPDPGAVAVYRWSAERFSRWVASRSQEGPIKEDRHAGAPTRVSRKRL